MDWPWGLEALPLLDTLFRTSCIAALAAGLASLAQSGGVGRAAAVADLAIGGTVFAVISLSLIFAVGDEVVRGAFRGFLARLRKRAS